jgi:hypothetical protein
MSVIRYVFPCLFSLSLLSGNVWAQSVVSTPMSAPAMESYARLPLAFEKHTGGSGERFTAHGQGYAIGLDGGKAIIRAKAGQAVSLEFAGSQPSHRAVPGPALPGKVNYIRGNDPRTWELGLQTYERVTYPDTYPGIDVVYYGNQQQLEFDLVVKPGADPEAIRLKVGGAGKLSIDGSGALVLGEAAGGLKVALPQIYQEVNGAKKRGPGHYAIVDQDEVAFRIDPWDHTRPLVIDPAIVYSVLFGGGLGSSGGNSIALDPLGNILITGYTFAADFPTLDAAQDKLNGSINVFVTKINPAGTALIYSTYLGGSNSDLVAQVVADSANAAWVTGFTNSPDFPVLNAAQATFGGDNDTFVFRLNASGALLFSTFLGGTNNEFASGIAVDNSNNGYAIGSTQTTDGSFPTTAGVISTVNASSSAYVTKYGPTGAVAYSTLLGSPSTNGGSIAADSSGDAYVTGTTYESTFPGAPAGGAQATNGGGGDAFVAKLNPTATGMLYFTFFGGSGLEGGGRIAIDESLNAFFEGTTNSTGLATSGAYQTSLLGGSNGFVAELNPSGSAFTYVTYLGGERVDGLNSLALDGLDNVYLAGTTDSANFPTVSPIQPTLPGNGVSLFNSTNSGGSWAAFDSNIPGAVFDVSINPADTSEVVLTETGIYRTVNGGSSWTKQLSLQLSALFDSPSEYHLSRSPVAAGTIYASAATSFYQSTDDGQTWNLEGSAPSPAAGILADPLTANTVYLFGSTAPYVFASTNGGAAWNPAATGLLSVQIAAMTATTDGSLYAGAGAFGSGIYKSVNQGGSWTAVNTGLPPTPTALPHSLSGSGTTVYFAVGASVWVTTNGGASWTASPAGFIGTVGVAASPQNASVVYALTFGGVIESTNGGASWGSLGTGLPSNSLQEVLVDPGNSTNALVIASVDTAGFVAKLNNTGSALTWSTYLGGTSLMNLVGVATDGAGNAFVTGFTNGGGFPVTSSVLPSGTPSTSISEVFLTKISDATALCSTLAVSPESALFQQNGGTLTFSVTAPSGCPWTAATTASWAVIASGASGTGSGIVTVQTSSNTSGATQSAFLVVGRQSIALTQPASSCTFSLDMSSYPVAAGGGSISAVLTATAGCPWAVTNNYSSAISFTTASSGTGNATIGIAVKQNLSTFARNFSLTVGTTQIQIAQAPVIIGKATTTTLVSSANPSTFGLSLTLTATVSPSAATGSVTFYDGTTVLGTGTLAGGHAAISTILLPAGGTRSLKAYYLGNSTYGPSTSAIVPQTVNAAPEGNFDSLANYAIVGSPSSIAVGDFNGDGKADLALADTMAVNVLIGNGDGTLQAPVKYPAGQFPSSLSVVDFNGDGNMDIVVANGDCGAPLVSVLLGTGTGTFQPAVSYTAPDTCLLAVAVADFNGDGKPDVVAAGLHGAYVFLGNGDGTLQTPLIAGGPGEAPESPFVAVGDFNGDGKADLVLSGGVSVEVLLGNGDGTFQMPIDTSTYSPGAVGSGASYAVGVADFNGDGNADLVVAEGGGFTELVVLLGNGDGSFQPAINLGPYSAQGVAVGDVNGDGKIDIAVAGAEYEGGGSTSAAVVLLGNGDGTFTGGSSVPLPGGLPQPIAIADFKGDGKAEIAIASLCVPGIQASCPYDNPLSILSAEPQPVAAFLDQYGAPALTFNNSTNFPDAGGYLIGPPAVAQAPSGDAYIVGLDAAGGVHLNSYSYANSTWNGWQYSGGILDTSSGMTAAVAPNGIVWFTGRDIGSRYWINSWNGTSFGGWILVADGIFAHDSIPQIAITSDGTVWIVGTDIGGRIWSNSYNPTNQTFTGWVDRQGVIYGQPSATAGQDGFVYVAARNVPSESPVYIIQIPAQNAATATTFLNGGGLIDTDPQITSQGGTVYLLAEADANTVYLLTFSEATQSYGTWTFTNGIMNSSTIAAEAGNVFIAGLDSSDGVNWYSVASQSWFYAGGAGFSSTVLAGAK